MLNRLRFQRYHEPYGHSRTDHNTRLPRAMFPTIVLLTIFGSMSLPWPCGTTERIIVPGENSVCVTHHALRLTLRVCYSLVQTGNVP